MSYEAKVYAALLLMFSLGVLALVALEDRAQAECEAMNCPAPLKPNYRPRLGECACEIKPTKGAP